MTATIFASLVAIHLAAAISPGPSFVVILRTAANAGLRPAMAMAVAFGLGAALWAGLAIYGLAAVFAVAPLAFTVLTYFGAAFLVFLGYQIFAHAGDPLPTTTGETQSMTISKGFRLGMVTQMSNPKPVIFFGSVFVAVLPVGISNPEIWIVLTAIFVVESAWYLFVAYFMSRPTARSAYGRWKRALDRSFGGLLALFGAKLALT